LKQKTVFKKYLFEFANKIDQINKFSMTSEQIQKLKSLGELFKNGNISKDESNLLKSEILNEKVIIDEKFNAESKTVN
jgi:hypothetical protein